jgi:hypothetical protein
MTRPVLTTGGIRGARSARALCASAVILIEVLGSSAIAILAVPRPAAGAPPALSVPQEDVESSPYDVPLAPTGELRILSFESGLVTSVVVAKPWLLAVLVQGHDVILQAKASSGQTQLIAYVDGVGTLWTVTIAPHGALAVRILVLATRENGEGRTSDPKGAAPAPLPGGSAPARTQAELAAFLETLTPSQRAGFADWQRNPTMEKLASWLATLSPEQRARFNALVIGGAIQVPAHAGTAPPLVDTTTVLHAGNDGAAPGQGGTHPATQLAPAANDASGIEVPPPQARPVHVTVTGVPSGISVDATGTQEGQTITVRYAVHNNTTFAFASKGISATDSAGKAITLAAGEEMPQPALIPPGHTGTGQVTIPETGLPVRIRWRWAGLFGSEWGVDATVTAQ